LMSIEAMKQALEALEEWASWTDHPPPKTTAAITAILTAIEQAEKQMPVGKVNELFDEAVIELCGFDRELLVYTTPPAAPVQEPVAWEQELTNLLCRIHRDGGHYIAERGWRKAIDDADLKVAQLNAASDTTPPVAPVQEQNIGALGMPVNVPVTPPAAPVQEPVWTLEECKKAIDTLTYIQGIAERGEGRAMRDNESLDQFVLGYVKKLEAAQPAPNVASPLVQEPPVVAELRCVCGAEWEWRNRDWELVSDPPAAQRQWVGLDDQDIEDACPVEVNRNEINFARAIEAKLKEKNT
jgi:hypothetical protein